MATIALINDDPNEVMLISSMLRLAGHAIHHFTSALNLEELFEIQAEVIMFFIGRSVEHDLAILQFIQNDERLDGISIIAISSISIASVEYQCRTLGCQFYLIKPVKSTELREVISEALQDT